MSSEMYLDITGTFRNINSPVKFTTGFVYMGPRLGAGLARTQTSQSVTGGSGIRVPDVTDRDTGKLPDPMSQSVTVTQLKRVQVLQI